MKRGISVTVLNIVGAKVWGGGEQYVYDMCDEFHRRKIESFVLIDESNQEFKERFQPIAGVITGNLYSVKGFRSIQAIAREMNRHQVDVIQCHSGKYILLCIALKKLTGAKLIFYKHNIVAAKHDFYHRWIQSQVDAFICVSKRVYEAQVIPALKDKYRLVYNGINTYRFPEIPDNSKKEKDVFTVGYAGRITENKGIFELLDALTMLHQIPKSIRIRICGDGLPDNLRDLHHYIVQQRMEEYVEFLGFQKDMNAFYRSLDCLVAPSKVEEAFGLVLCEAMYCGVPVIASRSGAQAEIIDSGYSGILIDRVDGQSIAKAIQDLMDYPQERDHMIHNGYERVLANFTLTKMVDSICQIIKSI